MDKIWDTFMSKTKILKALALALAVPASIFAKQVRNPIIWADVPDVSILRVGNTYYMSSTTMHMVPGLPIMKSKNLVDWQMCSYASEHLSDKDEMELNDGKNAYSQGTWASSLRYHDGKFYVSTFAYTTGKTHIYSTDNPDSGKWEEKNFEPAFHDSSLVFDDDGKKYLVCGGGNIRLVELKDDLSGVKEGGVNKIIIENAQSVTGTSEGLPAEGGQVFKVNGKYYIFFICWPPTTGMRTAIVYRSDKIEGPYEGRIAIKDKGVAQGGIVNTPDGKWFGMFFRDSGAVGRIPYLVPMTWKDGWPVFGDDGIIPMNFEMNAEQKSIPECVGSDEFKRKRGDKILPLQWQWNHNPNNDAWSLTKRPGYLRLETFRLDSDFLQVKNMLTQRTFGPVSSASIRMDVSKMKDGDAAGLALLQRKYATVEVKMIGRDKFIVNSQVTKLGEKGNPDTVEDMEKIPCRAREVYLKIECDFQNQKDEACFYYSTDGKNWKSIGQPFKMIYTLPHFMGYRFALFNYATKNTGGYVDFDYFKVGDTLSESN